MEKIYGVVLEKETNTGLPNLIVTAFDANSKEVLNKDKIVLPSSGRISSVMTDKNGRFSITLKNLTHNKDIDRRPDVGPGKNILFTAFTAQLKF